jgi:hypothetical protein
MDRRRIDGSRLVSEEIQRWIEVGSMDQILLLLVELRRWIEERWIEVGSMDQLILLFGDGELR